MKIIPLFALAILAFTLAFAQEKAPMMSTSEFSGVSAELVALVDKASEEITRDVVLDVSVAQFQQFLAEAQADNTLSTYADLDRINLDSLVASRDAMLRGTNEAKAAWDTYKATLVDNLLSQQRVWAEWATNMTTQREAAVNADLDLVERARAALLFTVAELGQRRVAIGLVQLRTLGQSNEVRFKLNTMIVKIINNAIAKLNGSKVGSEEWTVQENPALFADMLGIAAFARVASWRASQVTDYQNKIDQESQNVIFDLNDRLSKILAGTFTDVDALKQDWKTNSNETTTLADRLRDFVDASDVNITVKGLDGDGNITVTTEMDFAKLPGATQQQIAEYVEDHVESFMIANTGMKENEVTAVTKETVTSSKRATGSVKVELQLGNAVANLNNGNNLNYSAASSVTVAFAVLALAVAAALF